MHDWRDRTTHVVFEPQELIEKLVALVPPPRFHLVRYHGILGPCASKRGHVVPCDPVQAQPDDSVVLGGPEGGRVASLDEQAMPEVQRFRGAASHQRRNPDASVATAGVACVAGEASQVADSTLANARHLAWADLLRRVFIRLSRYPLPPREHCWRSPGSVSQAIASRASACRCA